jgi:hypothetical protein
MVGQKNVPSLEELNCLAELGFEGFNIYFSDLQPHLLRSRLRPIPALGETSSEDDLRTITAIPGAMMEASVTAFADYGKPLNDQDFERYGKITASTDIPVIAPSQKRFTAGDMPRLRSAGIAAPLLGVIVTGTTPNTLEAAIKPIVAACCSSTGC